MLSWIVMGITEERLVDEPSVRKGWWTGFPSRAFDATDGDYIAQTVLAKDAITKQIEVFRNDPSYARSFFMNRLTSEWAEPTFETRLFSERGVSATDFSGRIPALLVVPDQSWFMQFMDSWQSAVYVLAFLGIIGLGYTLVRMGWRGLPVEWIFSVTMLSASFIGGFLCYLFWEAKSLYVFPFFQLLFPLAAYGCWSIARISMKVVGRLPLFPSKTAAEHGHRQVRSRRFDGSLHS